MDKKEEGTNDQKKLIKDAIKEYEKEKKKAEEPAKIFAALITFAIVVGLFLFFYNAASNILNYEDNETAKETTPNITSDVIVGTYAQIRSESNVIYCSDTSETLDLVIQYAGNNTPISVFQNLIKEDKLTLINNREKVFIRNRAYQKRQIEATDSSGRKNVICWVSLHHLYHYPQL